MAADAATAIETNDRTTEPTSDLFEQAKIGWIFRDQELVTGRVCAPAGRPAGSRDGECARIWQGCYTPAWTGERARLRWRSSRCIAVPGTIGIEAIGIEASHWILTRLLSRHDSCTAPRCVNDVL